MQTQNAASRGHRPPLPVGEGWGEEEVLIYRIAVIPAAALPSLPSARESRMPALPGKGQGAVLIGRTKRQNQLLTPTLNPLNPPADKPRQPTHPINRVLNTRPISIHLNNSPANKPLTQQIAPKSLDLR